VRGVEWLSVLVRLVGEEARERRPGRDLVGTRLVEVMLIEALRAPPGEDALPGLLRSLADPYLAAAIRQMHGKWTIAHRAKRTGRRIVAVGSAAKSSASTMTMSLRSRSG